MVPFCAHLAAIAHMRSSKFKAQSLKEIPGRNEIPNAGRRARSCQFQIPNTKEIPNSQLPKGFCAGASEHSCGVATGPLKFRIWNFFGVLCLVFGVLSLTHLSSRLHGAEMP